MKGNVFRSNQSRKFHILSVFWGALLIMLGIVFYLYWYDQNIDMSIEAIAYMIVGIEAVTFGFFLWLINFEDGWIIKIVIAVIGFIIAGVLFNEQFRLGAGLFAGIMALYVFIMRFKNVFSTIVTISVTMSIFLLLTLWIVKLCIGKNGVLLLYSMFSLFVVFYRLLGVRINRFFISEILGAKEESKTYDAEQLKNQILFMYIIIFVILNVSIYLGKIDDKIWNLINNSFLTGLAIIQIDWNKIVFYFSQSTNEKKKSEDESTGKTAPRVKC